MERFRVDEVAAAAGLSVDTVRYYQTKGLLPAPAREGRRAWYDDEHLARLRRIRELKEAGLPLATIGRLLHGELDTADEALVAAIAGSEGDSTDALLDLDELAERTGTSRTLLEVIEREGLLVPHSEAPTGGGRYTVADAEALQAGLALLEAGLPLSEFLDLARRYDEAMRGVADEAVELFLRFVRDPIHGTAGSSAEAGERLVTAFRQMLPATATVVSHHFRRLLLAAARERIETDGDEREIALMRSEAGDQFSEPAPMSEQEGGR